MTTKEIPSFDYALLVEKYGQQAVEDLACCITENARSASGVPLNFPPTAPLMKAILELFSEWGWSALLEKDCQFIFTSERNEGQSLPAYRTPPPHMPVDRWVRCHLIGSRIHLERKK